MEPSFFNASSNESSATAGVSGPAAFAGFDIPRNHTGCMLLRKGVFVQSQQVQRSLKKDI
jgi:hypothetical protein